MIARTHDSASVPNAPLLAVTEHGEGRVAVLADSDLFGDDCIDDLDHRDLWLNLVYWAAGAGLSQPRRLRRVRRRGRPRLDRACATPSPSCA